MDGAARRDQAPVSTPITLSDYAKLRGVTPKAVSKAVAAGRLVASVGRNDRGQPVILDPAVADREWEANTRRRADYTPPVAIANPTAPVQSRDESSTRVDGCEVGGTIAGDVRSRGHRDVAPYNVSREQRAAADARRASVMADMAELELEEKRGSLVSADVARSDVIAAYSLVKTRLLAVPSAVGQRLPDLALTVVPVVEELVREALAELAVDGDAA